MNTKEKEKTSFKEEFKGIPIRLKELNSIHDSKNIKEHSEKSFSFVQDFLKKFKKD